MYEGAESRLDELRNAGLSPTDIAWSYILGWRRAENLERAHALVTAWSADNPGQPHNNYMRGFLLLRSNQRPAAAKEFQAVLEQQPGHELAEIALAELLDQQKKSAESLRLYVTLANGNPRNVNVLTGLARVLRKTGRPELARATLQPFLAAAEHSSTFAVEMACIELDSGDYERAATWLEQASPTDLAEHTTLSAAGIALAMLGDTPAQRAPSSGSRTKCRPSPCSTTWNWTPLMKSWPVSSNS